MKSKGSLTESHDVVKKTGPKRNQGIKGVNPPLHECARIDTLYITRNRTADVNILGVTYLLIRKSMRCREDFRQ